MTAMRRSWRLGNSAGHVARLAIIAAIAGLVHAEHRAAGARRAARSLDDLPLETIRAVLPEATAVGGESVAVAGGRELLDGSGECVGTVLCTSPDGDTVIGFSGPTDLLVVCDRDLHVAGIDVLSSGDTRDHVAAILRDRSFLDGFRGRPLADLAIGDATPHAVAGSTLTCHAIREALALRLGGSRPASRFAAPPGLDDLRRVFPAAACVAADAGDPTVIRISEADGVPLGWALRTSPAADRVIGYQGPTDAAVCFDTAGRVAGVVVATSFDNEPYVGYVRDDLSFRLLWTGMTVEQIAGIDPAATGVEGVSGATMTSQAIAEGIVRSARARTSHGHTAASRTTTAWLGRIEPPQWGALAVIATGVATAFTWLKGTWFGRLALPVVVLAYLGFGAGALLSQAQLWGWAQAGVPRGAVVLTALAAAAIALPATTRRNVYCSHLCAHGAAQQLILRIARPRRSLPAWLRPVAAALPWILLATAILSSLVALPLALVDLEPFDAYLPAVAGLAAIVIFAASLLVSCFVPMAYCRHACPTGALLDHLRLTGRSGRFSWRDGMLLACLAIAAATHWWPR